MVAMSNEIDLEEVERWSGVEGKSGGFSQIRDRLTGSI